MSLNKKKQIAAPSQADLNAAYVKVVSDIVQGDVISLGAVSLVGRGSSEALQNTSDYEEIPDEPGEAIWSLTIESEAGWYVIISQDCDIARTPEIEPALVVCPIKYVTDEEWSLLRAGGASPREFPFPDGRKLPEKAGYKHVADLRFVTSVDKTAVISGSVSFLRPLSAPQRAKFRTWVGARYAREPHSDDLERDVLPRIGKLIKKMAVDKSPEVRTSLERRLIDATEQWYLAGTNRRVVFYLVTSERSAKDAGFWDHSRGDFNVDDLETATRRLKSKMLTSLKAGEGYSVDVQVRTLHGIPADEFLTLAEWVIERPIDPLN